MLFPSLHCLWMALVLAGLPSAGAVRVVESKSLSSCQADSKFTASLFNVAFTPDNRSVSVDAIGVSSIDGNVTAEIEVIAYGYVAVRQTVDPCKLKLSGLCPMSTGKIDLTSTFQLKGDDIVNRVPGITYTVPDLDGIVRVYINSTKTGTRVACLQASLSNQKTVYQRGVGWATAVIAGMGLVASAITSGLGHSNTAAHIAANALSLFGYFQAQAMIGMASANLPPIVQSWTQNFEWSMGIMNVGFMQTIFTWYQRATGGSPASLLSSLSTTSVEVQKRSLDAVDRLLMRAHHQLVRRANNDGATNALSATTVVRGIKRVAFHAGIESTNLFMTGLAFYIIFVIAVILAVAIFKGVCELCVRAGWFKSNKFQEFRHGWKTVLKGILFRLTLIGYPQMVVLCLWEVTQRDSASEVVLALSFFIGMTLTLSWAALKVTRIAKRSVTLHKNPAYILYSDPVALNKWGFLYVQFRATAYYFIVPVLGYTLVKGAFIALSQGNAVVQAVALLLIELALLVAASILRPWMDKKVNIFNLSIAVVNVLNAIFLLFFTNVFNLPGIVNGVMGVIFFVVNAVFALVILVLVLVSTLYAIFSKNPDTRYQPMRDDRASFTKSQSQLNTELDALGATARGHLQVPYKGRDLDDDASTYSSASFARAPHDTRAASDHLAPPSTPGLAQPMAEREPPLSPVDPSAPLYPHGSPMSHDPDPASRYMYSGYNGSTQPGSDLPLLHGSSHAVSSDRRSPDYQGRAGSPQVSQASYRQQTNSSPWQRGAGYDH
ncbi:MAG: hypothetical protein M1826_003620 [Phylliscum demangeonii]|nr:MAG: hypothetical protein M1826_003620 [Phylliscum demangeonii]